MWWLKNEGIFKIDHLHNAGLDHALDVDLMTDETDSNGEEKQADELAPRLSSPPLLLSGNNDDNHYCSSSCAQKTDWPSNKYDNLKVQKKKKKKRVNDIYIRGNIRGHLLAIIYCE